LAFDLQTDAFSPPPPALRAAIFQALSAGETGRGKLLAASAMRARPNTVRDVLDDALTQIDLQRMAVERAIALIDGEAV